MEISESYDVVIVGAGPAGCMAAKFLNPNFNVLLIDKSIFPRKKTCGGLLSAEAVAFFRELSITPPSFLFQSPQKSVLVLMDWSIDKEYVFDTNFANMCRQDFDQWLLSLVPAHVQIEAETKLTGITREHGLFEVQLLKRGRKMRVKTQYLIGADGAMSKTRKLAFDSVTPVRAYVTLQEWIVPSQKINYFAGIYDKALTPYFCWVIPKGAKPSRESEEDMLILGGGFTTQERILPKWENFKTLLKEKLLIDGETVKREGDIILSPKSMREVCIGQGQVLLAGEAAGLINSGTGEGISFALYSGFYCAEAINKDFKQAFSHYSHLIKPLFASMRRKLIKSHLLSHSLGRRLLRFALYRKRDVLIKRGSTL